MELYCYSPEGVCLGVIEDYTSFRWVKYYGRIGTFRLVCPARYRALLTEGAVIWPDGDEEAGFVRSSLVQVKRGEETLEVAGETLTGLLGRRIIWKDITFTGKEEALMRKMVKDNAITPSDSARVLPRLALGAACGASIEVEEFTSAHEDLTRALMARSAAGALGFKTRFNPQSGQMTFLVYEGTDRSTAQEARSPVVFADEYENIATAEYRKSDSDFANAALVEGEKQKDSAPEVVGVGAATGLARYETYIRANGVKRKQDDGTELTDAKYRAALKEHGSARLLDMPRTQAADAEILAIDGNLIYGKDWQLGDIVTVQLRRWGVQAHLRVVQVEEVWERGQHTVSATFGEDARTLLERIERRIG